MVRLTPAPLAKLGVANLRNFCETDLFRGSPTTRVPNLWCFRPTERHPGSPVLYNSHLPGSGAHGCTHRFVVWPLAGGPRLSAPRLRPPTVWSCRLPDPTEVDHLGCS